METVYITCAVIGGTVLLCQLLMSLLGLGGDHDIGGHDFHDFHAGDVHASGHDVAHSAYDHASSRFLSLLSFRAIVAALTFFGLAGLAARAEWGDQPITLLVALAA